MSYAGEHMCFAVEEQHVKIPMGQLLELLDRDLMLTALEITGVESWHGYDMATANYENMKLEMEGDDE